MQQKNNNIIPDVLLKALEGIRGFEHDSFLRVHTSGEQVTSVRFNPAKWQETETTAALTGLPLESEIPWCPSGYYLEQRPSFTFDPLFHAGTYYVQEASSMFLWQVLRQVVGTPGQQKVLDLCAAPGGKTTLLASYFPEGMIVANEVIRARAAVLVENVTKWGTGQVVVSNNDPAHFKPLENYFDVIVVDAPCSGSGLFRKDPAAMEEWSVDNVTLCSQRQQRILADIYPALKQDGILIYSTCSYSKQENEDMLDWMVTELGLESCALTLDESWGIVEVVSDTHQAKGYRFYPDRLKGEGFFIAALRKTEGKPVRYVKKNALAPASKQETAILQHWLEQPEASFYFKQNDLVLAAPEAQREHIALLQQHLYLRKAGIATGTLKGKDLVPDHELALSLLIKENFPSVAVEKEDALQYLRKKEFPVNATEKGWTLITYKGIRLGWIKVLPGRVNNYYPVEWRILKD